MGDPENEGARTVVKYIKSANWFGVRRPRRNMILDRRNHLSDRRIAVLSEGRLGRHVETRRRRDESVPAGERGLRREEERAVRLEVCVRKECSNVSLNLRKTH